MRLPKKRSSGASIAVVFAYVTDARFPTSFGEAKRAGPSGGGEQNCPLKVRNLGSRSDFVW